MSRPVKDYFGPVDRFVTTLECWLVGGTMLAAVCILGTNVFLRYVFSAPIAWAEELAIRLVIWMVLVGASLLVRQNGHLAIDLLPRMLAPRGKAFLTAFVWAVSGCFFAWLFVLSIEHTYRTYSSGQILPMLQAPIWLSYLAIPVGSALMMFRIAQHVLRFVQFGMELPDATAPNISE